MQSGFYNSNGENGLMHTTFELQKHWVAMLSQVEVQVQGPSNRTCIMPHSFRSTRTSILGLLVLQELFAMLHSRGYGNIFEMTLLSDISVARLQEDITVYKYQLGSPTTQEH